MNVQELIANAATQRLDLRVLRRLAWVDEVQGDVAIGVHWSIALLENSGPLSKRIVAGKVAKKRSIFKNPQDVGPTKGMAELECEAFASEVVDDTCSDGSSIGKPIVHEVDRPAHVGASRTQSHFTERTDLRFSAAAL